MPTDINIHIDIPGLPELAEALKGLVEKAQQKVAEMSEPQQELVVLRPYRQTKDGNLGITYLRNNYGITQKEVQFCALSLGLKNRGTSNNPRYTKEDTVRILEYFGKLERAI